MDEFEDARAAVRAVKARIKRIEVMIDTEFERAREWGESFPIKRQLELDRQMEQAKWELAIARHEAALWWRQSKQMP